MAHYSIGHVVRLRDGMFSVRSTDYPACEGRDLQMWPAQEQFREALTLRARAAIAKGEMPPLYLSVEEARVHLPAHCQKQVDSPDRQPKSYDYVVIVEIDLPAEDAERFASIRAGKLLPEASM
jgi:hypothetical protein